MLGSGSGAAWVRCGACGVCAAASGAALATTARPRPGRRPAMAGCQAASAATLTCAPRCHRPPGADGPRQAGARSQGRGARADRPAGIPSGACRERRVRRQHSSAGCHHRRMSTSTPRFGRAVSEPGATAERDGHLHERSHLAFLNEPGGLAHSTRTQPECGLGWVPSGLRPRLPRNRNMHPSAAQRKGYAPQHSLPDPRHLLLLIQLPSRYA